MQPLLVPVLAAILLSPLLGGCAATPPRSDVREYLEEATGSSVAYVTTPAAFVIEQPGLASSGRDYVYVAPLVVSRGGERSCWLWLGIWSTVDRQARDEDASPLLLGSLQIVADDEPIDLDSQDASSNSTGIRKIPYATPVPPSQQLLVQVTRSQLERIGNARVLTLIDRPPGEASRSWRGDERAAITLNELAGYAGTGRN